MLHVYALHDYLEYPEQAWGEALLWHVFYYHIYLICLPQLPTEQSPCSLLRFERNTVLRESAANP